MGGHHINKIIHVSYRLEGGKSVTDIDYYSQIASLRKVGMSLPMATLLSTAHAVSEHPLPLLKTHIYFAEHATDFYFRLFMMGDIGTCTGPKIAHSRRWRNRQTQQT